ncbi:MAG: hypothetical protein COX62_06430 [Deltaproteobacteria bacterium CG_4_10_14_0_2_um_filter_43_8]|nr:MAG: hypothetical protein COV43_07375 [Deltaproteobacteria bacterium CG11_big_fil_rev_8_21_14_0_20_42_23]PJA19552.1 MAG: hypothetical protein COX62_06430 [Deltaproteobacteria bacterium CG_4_10_14_0_2_um_filter_43_8]PJC63927.1 MAG: hypothetical protein CO021_06870 [Deltaproteobacteria bacterium CG_4_9_14_0_2_um_filter_42_21]
MNRFFSHQFFKKAKHSWQKIVFFGLLIAFALLSIHFLPHGKLADTSLGAKGLLFVLLSLLYVRKKPDFSSYTQRETSPLQNEYAHFFLKAMASSHEREVYLFDRYFNLILPQNEKKSAHFVELFQDEDVPALLQFLTESFKQSSQWRFFISHKKKFSFFGQGDFCCVTVKGVKDEEDL